MDQESEVTTAAEPQTPSPAEAEARLLGWKPLEEFDGPEEKFKPAEEFLAEGKRINGFLRKDLDKLRDQLTRRDHDIAELKQTIAEFAAFHRETEKKAYERAKAELLAAKKDAIREGDGDRVVEIEEKIEQLREVKPVTGTIPPPPQVDPVFAGWVDENKWFAENQKLRAVANSYGELLRQEQPGLVGRPFLDEVRRRVSEDFPAAFGNPERSRPSAVAGSGEARSGTAGGKRSFSELPADAKAQCEKFVKQGLVASREQYVKDYFGE